MSPSKTARDDRSRRSGAGLQATGPGRNLAKYALVALVFAGIGAASMVAFQRKPAAPGAPAASEGDAQVRGLLSHYFETWSGKDIAGYGGCFSPFAQIWYAGQRPLELNLFLQGQNSALSSGVSPMHEEPLDMAVTVHNGLAHAQVHWELHEGAQIRRGYDFFTLVQSGGEWRIMALVFNEETP
jgi:hypothetical protein